ncbi:MAG: ABC transporter permease [Verrucomicrobia bacterium]|nr:ABC transporter permease [Verrucomicrobiota bacterium]
MITALKQIRFGSLLLLWLIALAIFAVRAPAFFTLANFTSILQFSTMLALVTLGQTFVVLAGGGGIDLSVGGTVSLSGLLIAFLMKQGMPALVAGTVGILFGGMLGSINGLIITRLRLLPLIVTLGTYYAYNGLALALTGGSPVTGLPSSFSILGQGAVFAIPLHSLLFVMPTFVVLIFILTQTPLGRWVYATGNNEKASRLLGLPVNAIRLGVYINSGVLAALAGLVADSWLLSARPNIGENLELLSLTATLLGGTSIFGGSGGLAGSLVAVLFFTSLQVGLQMLDINNIWQLGIVGLLLIGTVLLDRTLRTAEK